MKAKCSAGLIALLVLISQSVSVPATAEAPAIKQEMIHTMLLRAFEAKGSKEVAGEYQALIALRPADDKLHYRYGVYLEKAGDDRAVGQYKEAVKLAPANPDYWGALGNSYYRARNYRAALDAYKHAVGGGGGAKYQQLYQEMQQYLQQQKDYQIYQNKLRDNE